MRRVLYVFVKLREAPWNKVIFFLKIRSLLIMEPLAYGSGLEKELARQKGLRQCVTPKGSLRKKVNEKKKEFEKDSTSSAVAVVEYRLNELKLHFLRQTSEKHFQITILKYLKSYVKMNLGSLATLTPKYGLILPK